MVSVIDGGPRGGIILRLPRAPLTPSAERGGEGGGGGGGRGSGSGTASPAPALPATHLRYMTADVEEVSGTYVYL